MPSLRTPLNVLRRTRAWWLRRRQTRASSGELADENDVRACYRLLLGRDPDPDGWRTYTSQLGALRRDDLVRYFLFSPEFRRHRQRLSPEESTTETTRVGDLTIVYRTDDLSVGGAINRDHAYEPWVTEALEARLGPGSVFVDVGASIGWFTLRAAHRVGSQGRVIAFEPGPQNLPLLLHNIALNEFDNVDVRPMACAEEGTILEYDWLGGNGWTSAFDPDSKGRTLVVASTLDRECADLERLDVMKIDVEGAEGRVLRGGTATIEAHHPAMLLEYSGPSLETRSGESGTRLLGWLATLGYSFTALPTGRLDAPRDCGADVDLVEQSFVDSGVDHVDVLCAAD